MALALASGNLLPLAALWYFGKGDKSGKGFVESWFGMPQNDFLALSAGVGSPELLRNLTRNFIDDETLTKLGETLGMNADEVAQVVGAAIVIKKLGKGRPMVTRFAQGTALNGIGRLIGSLGIIPTTLLQGQPKTPETPATENTAQQEPVEGYVLV